jgi:heptosyltransferase-2
MHQKRRTQNHTVLYYRPLLKQFGIPWKDGMERFDLDIDEQILRETDDILKAKNVREDHSIIGFSPGAAWGSSKRWPAEHFREAAGIICSVPGRQAVFFGSPGDTEMISTIAGGLDTPFANLAGAFELLRHLVAAIKQCDLLVTNDSGPMHIAAAVGTPVIALFGPTNEKVSGPWMQSGCKALILRAPGCSPCYNPACSPNGISCLSRISPETVGKAAESILTK